MSIGPAIRVYCRGFGRLELFSRSYKGECITCVHPREISRPFIKDVIRLIYISRWLIFNLNATA